MAQQKAQIASKNAGPVQSASASPRAGLTSVDSVKVKPAKPAKAVQAFRLDMGFIGKLHEVNRGDSDRVIDQLIQANGLTESVSEPVMGHQEQEQGAGYQVGSVVRVPIGTLAEDPFNAREFYTVEDLDEMSVSLSENGQLAPVAAYEKEGKLWVFDGVKRLKAARSSGISHLRVDVQARPGSDLEIYMTSRRMNLERSSQSALDDAVRWNGLIEQQIVPSQQALAKLIGKSEGYVSQVLAINRIPRSVLAHMKERPKTSEQMIAYKLSGIFKPEAIQAHGQDELSQLAKEIVNEIAEKDLSRQEVDRLIDRRLGAPKQRARAEQQKFKCLGRDGVFKTFPAKGKVEFTVSGLSAEQMVLVEEALRGLQAQMG